MLGLAVNARRRGDNDGADGGRLSEPAPIRGTA